jgi:hypothetical protein
MTEIITSYEQCVKLWGTCRNKAKGKPISTYVRMLDGANGSFIFQLALSSVFKVSPDNVLTMMAPSKFSHRLAYISRLTVLEVNRVGHNQYTAQYGGQPPVAYFPGLQFDLNNYTFLNAITRKELLAVADKAKATEWHRLLRKFRAMVKARAALSGFNVTADEVARVMREYPYFASGEIASVLYNAVVNCTVGDAMLRLLISRNYRHDRGLAVYEPYNIVQKLIAKHSVALRVKHGVIKEDYRL